MPFVTLRVTHLRCIAPSGPDAERPERHAHSEHGHDSDLPDDYRSSRSSVRMPFVTLRVTNLRRTSPSGSDTALPDRHTPRSTNRNRGVFHEDGVSLGVFSAIMQPLSRTSSLSRPAARIKRGLVYDDGHEGVRAGTCKADQSISLTTCSEGSRDLPAFSSSCT